jgi:hypothetical protein
MRSYLSGNWDMMWMEEGFERCTGRRWIVEIVFSAIKRVFGEDLLSKKFSAQNRKLRLV